MQIADAAGWYPQCFVLAKNQSCIAFRDELLGHVQGVGLFLWQYNMEYFMLAGFDPDDPRHDVYMIIARFKTWKR